MFELDGRFAENAGHTLTVRVYYEDTDAGGIVYHASYLRFMERGRTAMLRLLGFRHTELAQAHGVTFAVRTMNIDFVAPGRLDDTLEVETRITDIGGASFAVAQTVRREDRPLATAKVVLATLGSGGKPTRIPGDVRDALRTLIAPGHV